MASLSFSASAWTQRIRSSKPKTLALWRVISRDFSVRSTAVTCAPARAKLMVSVPIPQPISSTFLPFHRSNSAKRRMCGSPKYLRASTSSKYSRVPAGLGECRTLHGRAFQYSLTLAMGVSSKEAGVLIVRFAKRIHFRLRTDAERYPESSVTHGGPDAREPSLQPVAPRTAGYNVVLQGLGAVSSG